MLLSNVAHAYMALVLVPFSLFAFSPCDLVINEINTENPGHDDQFEFIELIAVDILLNLPAAHRPQEGFKLL